MLLYVGSVSTSFIVSCIAWAMVFCSVIRCVRSCWVAASVCGAETGPVQPM